MCQILVSECTRQMHPPNNSHHFDCTQNQNLHIPLHDLQSSDQSINMLVTLQFMCEKMT